MPITTDVSTDLRSILKLEVPLIVQIASRRMSMREVANLAPGAIIELPKAADEELEVIVSNRQVGFGTAVKVGENFGVRITYVGDLNQRIAALGGQQVPMRPAQSTASGAAGSGDDAAAEGEVEADTADEPAE